MIAATRRPTAFLLLCLLLAGCSTLLAPVPDRWRFFNLAAMPQTAAADPPRAAEGAVCGLGPITLPAYLDRGEIATRLSPTEVSYSKTDRWADTLSTQVASVLLQDLSILLAANRIVPFPWQPGSKVVQQIEVTLRQFECGPGAECRLDARWAIREVRSGRFLVIRDSTWTRPRASDDPSGADALSQLLAELGREIAAALESGGALR
jgi:uncharacterized protein